MTTGHSVKAATQTSLYSVKKGSGKSALFFTLLPLPDDIILLGRSTITALGNIVTAEREVLRAMGMGGVKEGA